MQVVVSTCWAFAVDHPFNFLRVWFEDVCYNMNPKLMHSVTVPTRAEVVQANGKCKLISDLYAYVSFGLIRKGLGLK